MEFIEKKDHEVVLNALSRFMDSENVVLQVLRVLILLADPGITHCSLYVFMINDLDYQKQYQISFSFLDLASNVEILMSKTVKCYSLTCQAMDMWLDSESIQEAGCCLLRNFTSGEPNVMLKQCCSYNI